MADGQVIGTQSSEEFFATADIHEAESEGQITPLTSEIPAASATTPAVETPATDAVEDTQPNLETATEEVTPSETLTEGVPEEKKPVESAEKLAGTEEKPKETPAAEEKPAVNSNFYQVKAKAFLANNELGKDFPVDKPDLSQKDIMEGWDAHNKTPYIQHYQNLALKSLEVHGATNPHILNKASLLHNGVSESDVKDLTFYEERVGVAEFESVEAELAHIKDYLVDSDVSSILRDDALLVAREDEDKRASLLQEASEYFKEAKEDLETHVNSIRDKSLQLQSQKELRKTQILSNFLHTGKIGTTQFNNQQAAVVRDAMQLKNIPIPQADGTSLNLSAYEVFERSMEEDFSFKLWVFAKLLNGNVTNSVVQESSEVWGPTMTSPPAEVIKKTEKKGKDVSPETGATMMVVDG